MIRVIYYRSYNRLTIEGHAHSGEPGQDLVCAACSALAYTLAANVGRLESQGQVQDVIVQLEPGNAEISCRPNNKYKAIVACIMEAICVGFEILAADNHEYISYEIHG